MAIRCVSWRAPCSKLRLAAAKHLLALPGVFRAIYTGKVRYHHLLMQHQLVIAEGTGVETLYPGPQVFEALPARDVAASEQVLFAHEFARQGPNTSVRQVLLAHQARVLLRRRWSVPVFNAARLKMRP